MKKNNPKFGAQPHSARTSHPPRPSRGGKPSGPVRELEIPREWRPVIGTHAIKEALNVHPRMAKLLWLRQGWESSNDLREIQELAVKSKVKTDTRPAVVIDRFGSSHQGAALFMNGAPALSMEGLEAFEKSILLILDGIEDPHNLGAVLRTSWLMGVQGVLVPEDRAVGLTPTVHKVACGGAEHVPVVETTSFANYAEEFKKMGYWVYGLSPRGTKSVFDLKLPEKVVWVIGSEDKGMRVTTERLCDELVSIPQANAAASYNASVATAIALTETLRQHSLFAPRKNK